MTHSINHGHILHQLISISLVLYICNLYWHALALEFEQTLVFFALYDCTFSILLIHLYLYYARQQNLACKNAIHFDSIQVYQFSKNWDIPNVIKTLSVRHDMSPAEFNVAVINHDSEMFTQKILSCIILLNNIIQLHRCCVFLDVSSMCLLLKVFS